MTTFNREVFDLAADYAACPPEDTERKKALFSRIEELRGQDSEDCMMFSLMIFCARGDRNKVLADLQESAAVTV